MSVSCAFRLFLCYTSILRKTIVRRYFRQLQEISDTVTEITWEGDVRVAIASARADQTDLDAKINTGRARQRYLDHLAKSQKEGDVDQDDRCCVLCRCEFSRGYITQWCVFSHHQNIRVGSD